jgi:hypothetical protein
MRDMRLPSEAKLLRIFIGEADKHEGKPLYEAIVHAARKQGLAGATVLRGTLGFGANSHLHSAKILEISEDLPMVVEIVDTEEHINTFLPVLDTMIEAGMVTMEKVQVVAYRKSYG